MWIAIVAAVPLLIAAYSWHRQRHMRDAAPRLHRCGACGQRIRYQAAQAGRKGPCPRCWKPVTLPSLETAGVPRSRRATAA